MGRHSRQTGNFGRHVKAHEITVTESLETPLKPLKFFSKDCVTYRDGQKKQFLGLERKLNSLTNFLLNASEKVTLFADRIPGSRW